MKTVIQELSIIRASETCKIALLIKHGKNEI